MNTDKRDLQVSAFICVHQRLAYWICEYGGRRKDVMGYHLERNEPVPQGLRRIAREQLASAADELGKRGSRRAEGIHEARKSIKKVRAVLRLVRRELGNTFPKKNGLLLRIGRHLPGLR